MRKSATLWLSRTISRRLPIVRTICWCCRLGLRRHTPSRIGCRNETHSHWRVRMNWVPIAQKDIPQDPVPNILRLLVLKAKSARPKSIQRNNVVLRAYLKPIVTILEEKAIQIIYLTARKDVVPVRIRNFVRDFVVNCGLNRFNWGSRTNNATWSCVSQANLICKSDWNSVCSAPLHPSNRTCPVLVLRVCCDPNQVTWIAHCGLIWSAKVHVGSATCAGQKERKSGLNNLVLRVKLRHKEPRVLLTLAITSSQANNSVLSRIQRTLLYRNKVEICTACHVVCYASIILGNCTLQWSAIKILSS